MQRCRTNDKRSGKWELMKRNESACAIHTLKEQVEQIPQKSDTRWSVKFVPGPNKLLNDLCFSLIFVASDFHHFVEVHVSC